MGFVVVSDVRVAIVNTVRVIGYLGPVVLVRGNYPTISCLTADLVHVYNDICCVYTGIYLVTYDLRALRRSL